MPSPKIVAATWLMTVFVTGSSIGTMPKLSATNVMPMNRIAEQDGHRRSASSPRSSTRAA